MSSAINDSRSPVPDNSRFRVTVLGAYNLPRPKSLLRKQGRFYATVTVGERTWRTRSVQSASQRVEWNENVDTFALQPLPLIIVSLYAKSIMWTDILVGRQEIACEPRRELQVIFSSSGDVIHPTEPVTLSLTITMLTNLNSSLTGAANTLNPTTADLDNAVAEHSERPTVKTNVETIQPETTTLVSPLDETNHLPVASDALVRPVAHSQIEVSHTALRRAEEAIDIIDTIQKWKFVIHIIKRVMDTVRPIAALNPYASLAWSLLSKIPETLIQQVQRDDNVETLLEAIRDAFEFAEGADALRSLNPESRQAIILEEMLECVSECARFIRSYAEDVHVGRRALKNIVGLIDENVEQYRTNLVRLRGKFLAYATVIVEIAVLEAELGGIIRELPYKGGWRFGDEKRCLAGTREDFLDYIINWVENPESNRGLVLLGQAGTGKSSIVHEVARRFDNKCLGSYFAFLRKEGSKEDAYQLFTTLARDLSDRNPAFKHAVGRVVKDKSSLRSTRDYRTLFECLLLEPLKNLLLPGPIFIVIDALDESGDAIGNIGLHTFLAQRLVDLPSEFRILVTSRPENGIEHAFAKAPSINILYMNDAKLAARTEKDIGMYLTKELPPDVFNDHGGELARAAEGLFQWAAVATGFINNPPPSFGFSRKEVVQRLLGHSRDRDGQDPLDQLYEEVLEGYFKPPAAQTLFRSVMGQLFAAVEPLSINSLISLRRHAPKDGCEDPDPEDSDRVLQMLHHLGSVLSNITSSDGTQPIIPLHTSFQDFLADEKSGIFHVDFSKAHHQLAHSCLGLMLDNLKFNICKLNSSYLANRDVSDLESRITKYIPPALSYACVFWGNHLEHVAFKRDLFTKLRNLFEKKFLFWLEVLSINNSVGLASPALASLRTWLWSARRKSPQMEVENLLALVDDAFAFVRYFGMAIARSAPHIYLSALPFAPSSSRILEHYLHLFPGTTLECGQLSRWPALEMTIQAHDQSVESVAFSPDGQHIASASRDYTIRVWDAITGEIVTGPFTGHTGCVNSVAFSPDGQRITSASDDYTIRVWDAITGEVVAGPFMGHTSWVFFATFSPDAKHIASASRDCTIRMWDAATGLAIAVSFTGHTSWVFSVAFSPDGKRIASASRDRTVRVWDAATGAALAGPFAGHTDWVLSVAFSPHGQHIASASDDGTIRMWDTSTGETVAGPFIGHIDRVNSVAFSPDGQRIASASFDHTIRVWDTATGEVVAGPFYGHTDRVFSVAFSSDGKRLASASFDHTIGVWNATAGDVITGTFSGHTDWVFSVAFSPDGQRIASASFDRSICIWEATTGKVVALAGCTDWIFSVAFSPDGHRVASASRDCTIRVWDAATGGVVAGPFIGHTSWVFSVAFSPDGKRVASASRDCTIRMWDATTGEVVAGPFIGHTDWIFSVAFSPDGKHISSASGDQTIRVWDTATGEAVASPFTGHTDRVNSVAFSPDGRRIASASGDCTIRVWDATTGNLVAGPFIGHTDEINSVAFSPDGRCIASASDDCMILMWDAVTGHVMAGPFTGHIDRVNSIAFSPDGQRIVSASRDHTIRMWNIETGGGVGSSTRHVEIVRTEDTVTEPENIDLMNKFLINTDGWICGEHSELILWIPHIHRPYFHRTNTFWIGGKHETWLDLTKFVHGSNWATVYVHDQFK